MENWLRLFSEYLKARLGSRGYPLESVTVHYKDLYKGIHTEIFFDFHIEGFYVKYDINEKNSKVVCSISNKILEDLFVGIYNKGDDLFFDSLLNSIESLLKIGKSYSYNLKENIFTEEVIDEKSK